MIIVTIGIDLAKNVFQIHGVGGNGKCKLRKRIKRSRMPVFFANMSPCLIVRRSASLGENTVFSGS